MPVTISSAALENFATFGDLLRYLRRRVGITQMDLARAVGYSDAQISRLEQNLRMPDLPTIESRFVPALALEDEPKVIARLLHLASTVRREDAPVPGLCPYKGLNYFEEDDADLFVGREALTSKLTERVLSLTLSGSPSKTRFLAVVGASGSGKSSLVRAGLVSSLRWDKASADWDIHIITPGAHPLESLPANLMEENGSRLLLIVDQFEEVFALCHSEQERVAFIDRLLKAASAADGCISVVITLRADFYAHCAGYIQLRAALANNQEYIGAMTGEELRRAIEEPARRGRWELEPGLIELLLRDVGHEPGALPLLSHALLETWLRRRGRMMTFSGYVSSGGVRGAIAETAEAVFVDQLTPEQRVIARRIFLRLTELGDETATGDTRRRARFAELILKPEETTVIEHVLKALADARLIITSEDSVDVAHEALIREWPTLRGWLEENREGLRLHRHLTGSAQEWQARHCETETLYRGARLVQAREWASLHRDEMSSLEVEFLEASQAFTEQEAIEREAQRQRELDAAQKLAEAEHRRAEERTHSASQIRKRSVALTGTLGVVILLAVVAGWLGWQGQRASQVAVSRELAAAAYSNLSVDPERSILLALKALERWHTLEAEDALHRAIMASRLRMAIPAHRVGGFINVAFSPDGTVLASAGADETTKIWDAASGELLFTVDGHAVAFRPDGMQIATILPDRTVRLWDAATGSEIPLAGPINASDGLMFTPDGSRLVTVAPVNLPRIWDLRTAREVVNFPGHTDYTSFAFLSADGKRLLSTSDDGTARVWNASTGRELLKLEHDHWVWTAAFSPDGTHVATVSGSDAFMWDASTGEKLFTLRGHANELFTVAFSPDGTRLATGGEDRKVKVWDAASGRELFTLPGHGGAVYSLAFTPDGTRLASGSDDGSVHIWDMTSGGESLTLLAASMSSVSFTSEGTRLAAVADGAAGIWDAVDGKQLQRFVSPDKMNAACLSPNGEILATADAASNVILWDTATGAELFIWPAHSARINALTFSPDGARLVTASADYKARVWDVSDTQNPLLQATLESSAEVNAIAFSADGNLLLVGLNNGTAKLRDFVSNSDLLILSSHPSAISAVAFSLDGERLATASLDGTAKIWGTKTGQELIALEGHSDALTGVALSPDGRRVATVGRDGGVKLWDAVTGLETLALPGEDAALTDVKFSPDGKQLIVSGEGGVRAYLLDVNDLAALAQSRVTRPLSVEECQEYLHDVSSACAGPIVIPPATPLPPAVNGRICQVTSMGGLYDNYFNSMIFRGLQDSFDLYGWDATALQSASAADSESHLQVLINADCRLIVPPLALFEQTQGAAERHPDEKFMMMDFTYDAPVDNIWNQVYATDQAAFLAGYVAASATKTGKVGVFGGVDIPQVTGFMDGFALGVDYYNQMKGTSVEVIGWDAHKHEGLFAGGFCCTTEGRRLARQLLDGGADVLLPVAGQTIGWGAGAEVYENGNAWLIGVDNDWAVTFPEFESIILTSIEKRFDVSIVRASQAIAEGRFTGGIHVGTLETGEVRLAPFHQHGASISDEVKADLERIEADIVAGEIKTRP